jgi:hypothetical protein
VNDFLVTWLLVRGGMVLTMLALFSFVSGAPDVGWVFVYLLIVLGLITGMEYLMSFKDELAERVKEDWLDFTDSMRECGSSVRAFLLAPGVWMLLCMAALVFILAAIGAATGS